MNFCLQGKFIFVEIVNKRIQMADVSKEAYETKVKKKEKCDNRGVCGNKVRI